MSSSSSQASSVSSGGTITDADGNVTVVAGGTVSGLTINGTTEYVSGTATDTLVHGYEDSGFKPFHQASGLQVVASGGVTSHTTIASEFFTSTGINGYQAPASQTVQSGGKAFDTTISGQCSGFYLGVGTQIVESIYAGQQVENGGYASGIQVEMNASSVIAAGASAVDTTLHGTDISYVAGPVQGGYEYVSGTSACLAEQDVAGTSENVTVEHDGKLVVTGSAAHVTVSDGGMVIAHDGGTLSDITVGSGGNLQLDSGAIVSDPVTVQNSATLTFTDIPATGGTLSAVVIPDAGASTGHLEVFSGSKMLKDIEVQGDFSSPLYFTQAASGNYAEMGFGTPCYCPGTLIATPEGERPVETLRIGDMIRTASGQDRPIHWIGRRAYDPLFAHGNRDIMPILIRRDALGPGRPRRDLTVSPLHAMVIDGLLVPALHLVNDRSIFQLTRMRQEIRYIHIELDTHDLLLAEGTPSESFVDDGSRGMFHNATDYERLYPGAVRKPARYCAPRIEDGPALAAIQAALLERARQLQPFIPQPDPALCRTA